MNKNIRVVEGNAKPFEPFWQVRNAAQTGGDPEIDFVGYISEFSWFDDDVTPKKFKDDLNKAGKGGPITVRMHSGGGEIFAAAAIRAMLSEYPGKVTVRIEGLCASAAVAIALAGDVVQIYDTAYMMIHNPAYTFFGAMLDADTMTKMADELRVFKDGLLNAYETRTKISRDELSAMLDAETWMTAQTAVELGFADEVISGGKSMKTDVKSVQNYVNIPSVLLNVADEEEAPSENGQEPVEIVNPEPQARLAEHSLLESAKQKTFQEVKNMNVRELLNQRSALVERAEALVKLADEEGRDFTDTEREEFNAILGEGGSVPTLDAQIERVEGERAALKAAMSKQFSNDQKAEKPDAQTAAKVKSLAEFNQMSPADRMAFVKDGGKVQ